MNLKKIDYLTLYPKSGQNDVIVQNPSNFIGSCDTMTSFQPNLPGFIFF